MRLRCSVQNKECYPSIPVAKEVARKRNYINTHFYICKHCQHVHISQSESPSNIDHLLMMDVFSNVARKKSDNDYQTFINGKYYDFKLLNNQIHIVRIWK